MKKDQEIKWSYGAKDAFGSINRALIDALVLVSPDYDKEFQRFPYSSYNAIATVSSQHVLKEMHPGRSQIHCSQNIESGL